jgi:hypothetical protein
MNTRTLSWMAAVNKKCRNLFFNVIRYLKPFLLCWYWEIVVLSKVFGNFPFFLNFPHLSTSSAASALLAKLSRLSIDSRLVFYPSVFKSFPTPCCTLSHEGTTLPRRCSLETYYPWCVSSHSIPTTPQVMDAP